MVVIDKYLIDNLRQKLLARLFRFIQLRALIPVRAEMADQVRGFMQLVVVDGA
jgi:hypothetical protein